MRILTEDEKQRLRDTFEGFGNAADLQTTEELNLLILNWNWDYDAKYLFPVIRDSNFDKGSALYLFWLSEPYYFYEKYSDFQESEAANSFDLDYLSIIIEIEERYCNGFYTKSQFAYNLQAVAPKAFRSNVEYMALHDLERKISELICQPVKGETLLIEPEYYYSEEPIANPYIAPLIQRLPKMHMRHRAVNAEESNRRGFTNHNKCNLSH